MRFLDRMLGERGVLVPVSNNGNRFIASSDLVILQDQTREPTARKPVNSQSTNPDTPSRSRVGIAQDPQSLVDVSTADRGARVSDLELTINKGGKRIVDIDR